MPLQLWPRRARAGGRGRPRHDQARPGGGPALPAALSPQRRHLARVHLAQLHERHGLLQPKPPVRELPVSGARQVLQDGACHARQRAPGRQALLGARVPRGPPHHRGRRALPACQLEEELFRREHLVGHGAALWLAGARRLHLLQPKALLGRVSPFGTLHDDAHEPLVALLSPPTPRSHWGGPGRAGVRARAHGPDVGHCVVWPLLGARPAVHLLLRGGPWPAGLHHHHHDSQVLHCAPLSALVPRQQAQQPAMGRRWLGLCRPHARALAEELALERQAGQAIGWQVWRCEEGRLAGPRPGRTAWSGRVGRCQLARVEPGRPVSTGPSKQCRRGRQAAH
mmetsp:Transcript_19578/g.55952  ORF Transcript_19578/g.55952 Transcript_19578/m.55952 type:complete len:339 (+) Transcript_19578:391-1407(+)